MKFINSPKQVLGRTIYVSNHAASFMDPLVVAVLRMPIVFFMTRSDIFNKFTQPILWACHMFPIYRQLDGDDTKGKNEAVFNKCAKVLSFGRNLLIFGEGFTDDTFIRRLKPVKKGAVRIGFTTLEKINWKKKIYIAAVGVNYSDPNQMRSDVLISYSDKICLNDYRKEYEENPNKVINTLTKEIELLMQQQLTHINEKEHAPFHEQIMMINRKGMNALNFDRNYSLKQRWEYSRKLANWFNEQNFEENKELVALEEESKSYFSLIKRFKLQEQYMHWKVSDPKGSRLKEVLMMILLFPFAVIGAFHCATPYLLTKRFVEKTMKRRVFWGSMKLILGQLLIAIFNIPLIFIFYYYVYPSWWLLIGYFFSIGLTGLAAYMWTVNFKRFKTKGIITKMDISKLVEKRQALKANIEKIIPEL
jgi:hypothetical protein